MPLDLKITKVENRLDLADIVPLKQEQEREFSGEKMSEEEALDRIILLYETKHNYWIAKKGKEVVGYALGRQYFGKYESCGIYVKQGFRGNEIGLDLKKTQVEFARKEEHDYTHAFVLKSNKASIRMLEKAGFTFREKEIDKVVIGYVAELKLN